jgi:acyl-CoA synthetase (NDP forming)
MKARPLELPERAGPLSERASKQCLAHYGIPLTREVALSLDQLAHLTEAPLPFPVAVKIDSPDIAHKTEARAVRLHVQDLTELKRSAGEVVTAAQSYNPRARLHGVLVSEMVEGQEVIVGVVNDRFFGPLVMFGLGGVFTELLQDVAYRYAPFDTDTAREMIVEIRSHAILTGYRGAPPLATDALADTLVRVSWLAHDYADRIATLDINPLFVNANGVRAADALLVLRER